MLCVYITCARPLIVDTGGQSSTCVTMKTPIHYIANGRFLLFLTLSRQRLLSSPSTSHEMDIFFFFNSKPAIQYNCILNFQPLSEYNVFSSGHFQLCVRFYGSVFRFLSLNLFFSNKDSACLFPHSALLMGFFVFTFY